MSLSGRPLFDNRRDADVFVDRDRELGELSAALRRHLNVVVSADAGTGKTSLLQQFRYRSRTDVHPGEVYYCRAEGIDDGAELLAAIAVAVLGREAAGREAAGRGPARLDDAPAVLAALADHLDAARIRLDDAAFGPVIIVDDVTATAGHALFGRLRDELWSLDCQWVLSVRTADRGGLLLPPADAFFEHEIGLEPLPGKAAVELLQRRRTTGWSDPAARKLVDAIGGHPRRLLAAARAVQDNPDGLDEMLAAINRRDAAIAQAGRSEAMLAAELDGLGSASASDDALLTRLNWTRARAVQVLTRLEKLGLVRGEEVKLGRGRPRKVYRLTPPAEYIVGRESLKNPKETA